MNPFGIQNPNVPLFNPLLNPSFVQQNFMNQPGTFVPNNGIPQNQMNQNIQRPRDGSTGRQGGHFPRRGRR